MSETVSSEERKIRCFNGEKMGRYLDANGVNGRTRERERVEEQIKCEDK
jgi:hypothetical protein